KVILERNRDSDRIHYYLGSLHEETKRNAEAIAELRRIQPESKLYPEAALHVRYLRKQETKVGQAKSHIAQVIAKYPKPRGRYLLKQEKTVDEAKSHIAEVIAKYPKHAGFYMFQANLEEEDKNVGDAVAILEKAIGLFPEDEKLRYYLGSLYDRQGEVEKGIAQ